VAEAADSPAGLDLFSGRLTPTTLAFISTDSTPEAPPALSYDKFSAFARQQGYTRASPAVAAAASTTPIIA